MGGPTDFMASAMPEAWSFEMGPLMLSPISDLYCFARLKLPVAQKNEAMNSFVLTFWSELPSFTRETPPANDCMFVDCNGPFWLFVGALLSGGFGSVSANASEDDSSRRRRRPITAAVARLGLGNHPPEAGDQINVFARH